MAARSNMPKLPPPRCPALVIHGDRDAINPTEWSAALATPGPAGKVLR